MPETKKQLAKTRFLPLRFIPLQYQDHLNNQERPATEYAPTTEDQHILETQLLLVPTLLLLRLLGLFLVGLQFVELGERICRVGSVEGWNVSDSNAENRT